MRASEDLDLDEFKELLDLVLAELPDDFDGSDVVAESVAASMGASRFIARSSRGVEVRNRRRWWSLVLHVPSNYRPGQYLMSHAVVWR